MNLSLMNMLKVMLQKLHSDRLQRYQVQLQQTCTMTNTEQFGLELLSNHFAMDHNVENMQNSSTQPIDLNKVLE